jgi:flagellar basal-body rod protein FlgF
MENTSLIGLSRLSSLERQMDMVSNNIANLNTTGFKANRTVFQEYLMPGARAQAATPPDALLHFVYDRTSFRNLGQGPIQQTGGPLDIAINGDAYLSVQSQGGERFTRDGSMQINANGQLVTLDGAIVNGDNGPIVFQPNDRNISISSDGRISVLEGLTNTESIRGKLKLSTFTRSQQLQNEGGNLFSAPATAGAQPAPASVSVVQGAIEGSNVNGVREMTRMIEINRNYTMINSLLNSQQDQRQSAIDKLVEVPT